MLCEQNINTSNKGSDILSLPFGSCKLKVITQHKILKSIFFRPKCRKEIKHLRLLLKIIKNICAQNMFEIMGLWIFLSG
jgi:hypothetical protein